MIRKGNKERRKEMRNSYTLKDLRCKGSESKTTQPLQ